MKNELPIRNGKGWKGCGMEIKILKMLQKGGIA
jgi:hypothetical protein